VKLSGLSLVLIVCHRAKARRMAVPLFNFVQFLIIGTLIRAICKIYVSIWVWILSF
jgi:hypothetical protein